MRAASGGDVLRESARFKEASRCSEVSCERRCIKMISASLAPSYNLVAHVRRQNSRIKEDEHQQEELQAATSRQQTNIDRMETKSEAKQTKRPSAAAKFRFGGARPLNLLLLLCSAHLILWLTWGVDSQTIAPDETVGASSGANDEPVPNFNSLIPGERRAGLAAKQDGDGAPPSAPDVEPELGHSTTTLAPVAATPTTTTTTTTEPEVTSTADELSASEQVRNAAGTTSGFDELMLGYDSPSATTTNPTSSGDMDYMLAGLSPTGAPQTSNLADETPAAETSAALLPGDEYLTGTTTERSDADSSETSSLSPSVSLYSEDSDVVMAAPGSDDSSSQLVRSRKSSENGANSTVASADVDSKPTNATNAGLLDDKRPKTAAKKTEQKSISFPSLDYDDFDLDYQLKLNTSIDGAGDSQPVGGMNKRDQDGASVKPPPWSTLILHQPHVFSSTLAPAANNQSNSSSPAGSGPQAMLPSLLTVHSTQLTHQELNRVRPQFLFYQDNDQSYGPEQSQNGDLLATASVGGNQMGFPFALAAAALSSSNLTEQSSRPSNSSATRPGEPTISLVNGSPVVRHNIFHNILGLRGNSTSRLIDDSSQVTTIMVDNLAPTEMPTSPPSLVTTIASAIASPISTTTTTTSSTTTTNAPREQASGGLPKQTNGGGLSGGSSHSNQWHNYPHPNLHHNPLLLHHILNKPSVYTQHVGANQQKDASTSASTGSEALSISSSTHNPTSSFSSTTQPTLVVSSTSHPSATTTTTTATTSAVNIIEKPTLAGEFTGKQQVNKTQLQMQLNEMRSLANMDGYKHVSVHPKSGFFANEQAGLQSVAPLGPSGPNQPAGHHSNLVTRQPQSQLLWKANEMNKNEQLAQMIAHQQQRPRLNEPSVGSPGQTLTLMKGPVQIPKARLLQPLMGAGPAPAVTPLVGQPYGAGSGFNVLHHLIGNNLAPTPATPTIIMAPAAPPVSPQAIMPGAGTTFAPAPPNRVNLYPATQLHSQQPQAIRQPAMMFASQPAAMPLRPVLGGQIMTAPSLLQQVYTPRPASMFSNTTTTANHASNQQSQTQELIKLLDGINGMSRPAPVGGLDENEAASTASIQQSHMSDEDMSTYVSQLAALSAQSSGPGPEMASGAWNLGQGEGGKAKQAEVQQTAGANSEDVIKFIEKLIGLSQAKQTTPSPSQTMTVEQLLRQAKLVGLPEDVQAQIYNDLNLNQPPTVAKANAQHSSLMSSLGGIGKSKPLEGFLNAIRQQAPQSAASSSVSPSLSSDNPTYYSIDGHQEQQKKLREQNLLQNANRDQRQQAFIEALRTSVTRLQNMIAPDMDTNPTSQRPAKQVASSTITLTPEDLWSMAGTEFRLGNSSSAQHQTDFDDHITSRPAAIPDWLERQIMQDSFVHESSRINPFGQSTKSTIIGRNPLVVAPLGGGGLGATTLTPLSVSPSPLLAGPGVSHPIARPLYQHLRPLHALATGPSPRFLAPGSHHHPLRPLFRHHHAHSLAMEASQPGPAAMLHPMGPMGPLQPINPTKLLSDRFPMASAPAYLVKLPTLTGGTITASGSLSPPFKLTRNRPMAPLRFLNGPGPMLPAPQRLRLISSVLQPASSVTHIVNHAPLHHLHPLSYGGAGFSPAPYQAIPVTLAPATHLQVATNHQYHNHQQTRLPSPSSSHYAPVADVSNLIQTSSSGQTTDGTSGSNSAASSTRPAGGSSPSAQVGQSGHTISSSTSHHQPASLNLDSAAQSGASYEARYPNSALDQQTPTATALSRLQQATASLVELTSLASLVEEMVGGSDIETSPAAALANAINSLSAAQNAALATQASTNGPMSAAASGSGEQTSFNNNNNSGNQQLATPFSWRNLLNPALWRDKSFLKSKDLGAIERLVAQAARRPPARLKVKYIRVPVAVYETTSNTASGNGRPQLVTKTQLAEIVANGGSTNGLTLMSDAATTSGPHSPATLTSTSVLSPTSSSATASQSAGPQSPSNPVVGSAPNGQSPTSNNLLSSTVASTAATSNDYLFDEISADSAPQIALAIRDHYLAAQQPEGAETSDFLPLIKTLNGQPIRNQAAFPIGLSPLESNAYYTLAGSAPPASIMQSLAESASKAQKDESSKSSKRKRKKKKKGDDDDDDDDEEDDDDDLLSSSDLPVIESILSTLAHGPHLQQQQQQQQAVIQPAASTSIWSRRPFGSALRGEASTNVETYTRPLIGGGISGHSLNPFGKHSPKFSLGEVVGALGARKLITSLLSKRKNSRTSKRAAQPVRVVTGELPSLLGADNPGLVSKLADRPSKEPTNIRKHTFPPMSAYDQRPITRRPVAGTKAATKSSSLSKEDLVTLASLVASTTNSPPLALVLASNNSTTTASSSTTTDPPINRASSPPSTSVTAVAGLDGSDKKALKMQDNPAVQFKFFLKSAPSSPRPGKQTNQMGGRLKQFNSDGKLSIPLYHVVADHYNKLYSGSPQLTTTSSTTTNKASHEQTNNGTNKLQAATREVGQP